MPERPARAPRAPYGRRSVDVLGDTPAATEPPTYYDRPALKAGHWGFLVATYFFVGGIAGAAQVIATIVDLVGSRRDRPVVSAGRYLAVAGALVSPLLLIGDLQTPGRWYNMLRIYRGTSAMSIGSWTLAAFGSLSGVVGLAQIASDLGFWKSGRRLARLVGVPAAASGATLAAYTGTLLAATSVPLWSSAYRTLPALFAFSGTATATAALSLLMRRVQAPRLAVRRLDRLALLVSLAELVLSLIQERTWKRDGAGAPLTEPPLSYGYAFGVFGLGILAPLSAHLVQELSGRELPTLSVLAALSALVGGYCQRSVLVLAGRRSASRPRDYFRLTAAGHAQH